MRGGGGGGGGRRAETLTDWPGLNLSVVTLGQTAVDDTITGVRRSGGMDQGTETIEKVGTGTRHSSS